MMINKKQILSYRDRLNFGPFKGSKVMSVLRDDPSYIVSVENTHHTIGFRRRVLNDCETLIEKRKI